MSPEGRFQHVGIVGLGLMGGSLARALSGLAAPPRVSGWSPDPAERSAALEAGAVAAAPARVDDVVRAADLVVYAVPLEATLAFLPAHAPLWDAAALVTDVCSLKAPVLEAARATGAAARFVGGHPMAGSHRSGFAAAEPGLYAGARVWLTVEPDAAGAPLDRVADFWRRLGADPVRTAAHEHDRLMAWASHLPQVTASALAACLATAGVPQAALGPGGRDTTRLAGSPPDFWRGLLLANAAADLAALDAFARTVQGMAAALRDGDADALAHVLERAHDWKLDG